MYVPAAFRNDDAQELRRLMQAHDFATLVTTGPDGAPFATHLPLLVENGPGQGGEMVLRSHMARANPQWQHFANGTEALAIFHGPHALVHSTWYKSAPNVPTWNYAVVHAYGPVTLVEEAEATRGIAYRLVAKHAPDTRPIPPEYEARLLAAVVTFELRVTRLEGKYKLNQNKGTEDRERVRRALAEGKSEGGQAVAELMQAASREAA